MTPRRIPLRELAQLVRLRSLRTLAAARRFELRRRELADALAAIAWREARIVEWRRLRADLAAWIVGPGAPDLARFAAPALARRQHLAEQQERDEYALGDEQREAEAARDRLAQAQAHWLHERAREDEARAQLRGATRGAMLARDEAQAVETSEAAATRGPGAWR